LVIPDISIDMLAGIISDVHSNAVALRAVLLALEKAGVTKILHAGDVVGYNPYPDETIRLFRENNIISILGNHDLAMINRDLSGFKNDAAKALVWTLGESSPETFDYIKRNHIPNILKYNETNITKITGYIKKQEGLPKVFHFVFLGNHTSQKHFLFLMTVKVQ